MGPGPTTESGGGSGPSLSPWCLDTFSRFTPLRIVRSVSRRRIWGSDTRVQETGILGRKRRKWDSDLQGPRDYGPETGLMKGNPE